MSEEGSDPGEKGPVRSENAVPPPLPRQDLPPVLPPTAGLATPSATGTPVTLAGRLHPLTLLIGAARMVRSFALPALVVFVTSRSLGGVAALLIGILGFAVLRLLVRYFTFGYRVQAGELITRQGVLSRQERHIPLRRVQDMRLEAGLLHRLLGVVDVRVETAGGAGVEAELSVLARADAEVLRRAVFEGAGRSGSATGEAEISGQCLARLTLRDLVVEGLTSNRAASLLVVLGAIMGFGDDLLPRERWTAMITQLGQGAEQWLAGDGAANWRAILTLAGAIVVLSAVFSVAGSIVLFHGFTLVRRGEDLFRTYGLFTRRAGSLLRRRIQLLQVEEPWLRRGLGLAVVRADTAARPAGGKEEQRGGRDLLLPLTQRRELGELLPQLLPELGPEPAHWQKVAPCAVRRATIKAAAACLLGAVLLWTGPLRSAGGAGLQLQALWVLSLIPVAYWVSRRSYFHLGFADEGAVFRTRRGWLNRTTHVVPVRNLQVVVLQQTPWDRRHGVWTLKLDTAGQTYTGGGPLLRNMPAETAWATGRSLARRATRTRYRV